MNLEAWADTDRTARLTVGVGEMKVSADPSHVIVTHALGSCLGIVLYDPAVPAAGMLHALLPRSASLPERARDNPLLFVDTGLSSLFLAMFALGASPKRIQLSVAGGACVGTDPEADQFQIGRQNIVALRRLLHEKALRVHGHLVAGTSPRTLSVSVRDGRVRATTGAVEIPLEQLAPW